MLKIDDMGMRYIMNKAIVHTPANKRRSFMDMMLAYYNIMDVVNFEALYENFVNDKNFTCIRFNGKQKVHDGGPCKQAKRKTTKVNNKNKKIKNWTNFQNKIQIVIVDNTGKEYDIKLFRNASYTITGCNQPGLCKKVAEMLIKKINNTQDACGKSELSRLIGREMLLDVPRYSAIKYSMIKSSAKTNLDLKKSASNTHGLRQIYQLLTTTYANLLPAETHPALGPKDMPIRLNAPQLATGKSLMFRLVAPDNSLMSMHLNKTGTLTNFAQGSISNVDYGYNTLKKIFTKHYTDISN